MCIHYDWSSFVSSLDDCFLFSPAAFLFANWSALLEFAADVSPFALFASAHNLTNSSLHKISNPTVPSNPLPFCLASTYPTGICFPPPTVNTNKASPFESSTTVNPLFNSS